MSERMLRRVMWHATGKAGGWAGSFRTKSDEDAITQARLNFQNAPMTKLLQDSPGFGFEVSERTPIPEE